MLVKELNKYTQGPPFSQMYNTKNPNVCEKNLPQDKKSSSEMVLNSDFKSDFSENEKKKIENVKKSSLSENCIDNLLPNNVDVQIVNEKDGNDPIPSFKVLSSVYPYFRYLIKYIVCIIFFFFFFVKYMFCFYLFYNKFKQNSVDCFTHSVSYSFSYAHI
jgi:hypothetical protein